MAGIVENFGFAKALNKSANVAAAAALTSHAALTMVANVSGATENYAVQDSSAQLSQAEFRVFAKTVTLQLNALLVDITEVRAQLNAEIAALKTAGLQATS
jgi:hypothetical protein